MDVHKEMEHCLKLVNNHWMLASVIDKQNSDIYTCMVSIYM